MAVPGLGASRQTTRVVAAVAFLASLMFLWLFKYQPRIPLPDLQPGWAVGLAEFKGSLLVPTVESGRRDVLIQALDYRTAFRQLYEPHQYAACATPSLQCWLPLVKQLDCKVLFDDYLRLLEAHKPAFPTPKELPTDQRDAFLLKGYTSLSSLYIPQPSHAPDAEVPVWTPATIKDDMSRAKARSSMGAYGDDAHKVYQALDCHPVTGLNGAVFGTETPWLEGILFTFGAKHILTIEFRATVSHIPNHQVVRPLEWVQGLQDGSMPLVDFAISYSSWEHDGLGRYGDPVDPWGDVKAMQRASCYVKPGGLLYLGVPASSIDQLQYNAHRIYGPVRLPLMTANWDVIGAYDASYKVGTCGKATCESLFVRWQKSAPMGSSWFQPVIVLRNTRKTPCQLQ